MLLMTVGEVDQLTQTALEEHALDLLQTQLWPSLMPPKEHPWLNRH